MGDLEGAGVFFASPAEAEADLNSRTFRNSLEEKLYRDGRKRVIDEQESLIRDGAVQLMEAAQEDADGYRQEAEELLAEAQAIRKRMKRREIPAKEARDRIADLNKKAGRLVILAETLPGDYAKALHDRDHPRDVLEFLYRKYPLGPIRFDF
ncbi:hypothetical protein DQ237_11380 [Blastococcus sp. TF02-8]|uniref:hypothetical protein n=1 Tax=Blastococcus sp. TF02-8 TaxID=2250574 RepID=UPI000DEA20DD|nr:hypothetical protein [Blastococcus sp. TF02-8]RBY95755.1 hypothetical protein DQ237_11380 [Blastococcus sp. TF02-8]